MFAAQLWDAHDADVGVMNRMWNLTAMSRGLNIGTYAHGVENQMRGNAWRRWKVTPQWQQYSVREKHVAHLLNLPLKAGKQGDGKLTFEPWSPSSLRAEHGGLVTVADENSILGARNLADDGLGLEALLRHLHAWNSLTDGLQQNVLTL